MNLMMTRLGGHVISKLKTCRPLSQCPAHSTYLRLTHKLWASCGHALGLSDWRLVSGMTVWEPQSNLGASITVRLLYKDLLVAP